MPEANIKFNGQGFQLEDNLSDKQVLPGFIKSYECEDEFECNLLYATWMQYSKGNNNIEFNKFQWIWKTIITVIGRKSQWSLH